MGHTAQLVFDIAVVVFIIVGILAACIALVATVQRALSKLAQMQQLRVLAEDENEYGGGQDGHPFEFGRAGRATG